MLKAAGLLTRLAIGALTALTAACVGAQYFLANAPTVFGAFDRTTGLKYGEDRRQALDVYSPRRAQNRPVVIFWYGGSWSNGTKSNYRFVGAALAERGFVVVLPDYRLYPAVKYPLFLEDGARAVAWVQQHAGEFGGDPQRIVLMGHSAGAHMAAFLAFNRAFLAAAGARPASIKGLVGLSGPYALDPNSEILRTIFATPYSNADWQPVRYVDAHAPPALLFHGSDDTVVEVGHTERLREVMMSHHVPVDAQILVGRKHADTVAAFALGARHRAPVLERTVKFIERVTAQPAASSSSSRRGVLSPQTDPSP